MPNATRSLPDDNDATFAGLWEKAVSSHGPRSFLTFDDGGKHSTWTYSEFGDVVERLAQTLVERGVGAGDSVHVCLRNCPAFVAIWFAASRIGAWIVPVDPQSTSRDLAAHIRRTSSALGVCARSRREAYHDVAHDAGVEVLELAEDATDLLPMSPLLSPAAQGTTLPPHPDASTRIAVMFTSGTTSEPKGVVLSQANYHCVATSMAAAADLRAEHRWFVTLPLFHANAQFYCFASAIVVGASVALTQAFSASRWVSQARELQATHASLFAAPMRMILARTPADEPPAHLQHVWFAQSLAPDHHRDFGKLAGCLPRQLYGMTETIAVVTYDRSEPALPNVIGKVLESRRAVLMDPATREPARPGHPGIITVAGRRGRDLFEEYLDDAATTERAFFTDDRGQEWFLTGDLATENNSGDWVFTGRVDDVIKVAGENVSLTEIEAAVAAAPGVLEVAVVPVADEIRDMIPVAHIVPRDSACPPAPEDLARWAESNLAPAARPREWHLIEELPRTSVGKLRRFKLHTPAR